MTSMENIKIRKKNEIHYDIKIIEKNIERNDDAIMRLESQSSNTKQINLLITKNEEYKNELIILKENLIKINKGEFDFTNETDNNVIAVKKNKQKIENAKLKIEVAKQKIINNTKQKAFNKNRPRFDYRFNNKNTVYTYPKETDKFFRDVNTVPDYIKSALKDMPNNKGYIWKNIWLFGNKPSINDNEIIMFQNMKGGIQHITNIKKINNKKITNIYEKRGKNSYKNLIFTEEVNLLPSFGIDLLSLSKKNIHK
jgi:hypothetical protein